jgi:hypothetical protein
MQQAQPAQEILCILTHHGMLGRGDYLRGVLKTSLQWGRVDIFFV